MRDSDESEFHGKDIVGHVTTCCKEGVTCLETSARGVERKGMGMGIDADVEVSLRGGIRTGLQATFDEGEARTSMSSALEVGQCLGDEQYGYAVVVRFGIAEEYCLFIHLAETVGLGAYGVFTVFGIRNEEGTDVGFLEHRR